MAKAPQRPAARAATPAPAKQQPAPTPSVDRSPRQAATVPAVPRNNGQTLPAVRQAGPITVQEPGAPMPAFMEQYAGQGIEDIGRDDLEIPRLKLIQGTNKELQVYNALKPGHFFHTVGEMIFEEPFRVVPLWYEKRFILWRPLDDGGGILARADDAVHWNPPDVEFTVTLDKQDGGNEVTWRTAKTVAESGLHLWGTMDPENKNSPPAATLMYSYVFAFPDIPDLMPAAFTFQRSSLTRGKRFNTKLRVGREPIYGRVFEMSSVGDRNKANKDFWNVNLTGVGTLTNLDRFTEYREQHEGFKRSGMKIKDEEELQAETPGTNEVETEEEVKGQPRMV